MTEHQLNSSFRNRLTRYLHTGNEVPKYFPGCWNSHKYFENDKLQVLNQVFTENHDNVEVVDIILKAYKDGYYTRFETIAFALSKCLILGSPIVKEATYKAVAQVYRTTEQMLMFNKFNRLLKTGNGRGWCKLMRRWYLEKDPMDLAKEMTRIKARHGRSHNTLIRKSHLKLNPDDHSRDAVIKYTVFGLKQAIFVSASHPETKPIVDYIKSVEDLRHCEDEENAAAIAISNNFTLDHVPGHLLTSQSVWNAIMRQFSLSQLLKNILRIHYMGFLTDNSPTTEIIVSMLNDKELIKNSNLTALEVYITLCNYKMKSRPLKYEKAKVAAEKELRRRARQTFDSATGLWKWINTKKHPKENKHWGIDMPPNQAILGALNDLLANSWNLTKPTNKRYLITMDMRHHMFKGRHFCKSYTVPKKGKKAAAVAAAKAAKLQAQAASGEPAPEKKSKKHLFAECFYNRHVTPGHAAIVLALHLLNREPNVQLAVFVDDGIEFVTLERKFGTVKEAEFVWRQCNVGRVQLDAPIQWAAKNDANVDVFINMIDRSTRFMELELADRGGRGPGGRYGPPPQNDKIPDRCPVRALQKYKQTHERNAKLIVMSLASHRVATTDGSHEGVLDIVGIDEHVPKLLDAFALDQFK